MVTIVVLIILATISINAVFGENGIIKRAEASKKLNELEEEKQRLELIKSEVLADNSGKMTVDLYVKALKDNNITVDEDITANPDGSKTVITDTEYSVLIEQDGKRNVKITIEGKAGNLPPRIKNVTAIPGEGNITVVVDAIRTEGATLKYYYKTSSGSYQTEGLTADSTSGFTITGLDENEVYTIKIELSNEHGTASKEITATEEDMLAAPPKVAEGMIPVKYEESVGKWVRTTEDDENWYNYSSKAKKWANVVLSEATWTNETVNGQTVQALDESKPYSQLVWIPRYAYKITSMYHMVGSATTAGEIAVAFIDSTNKDKNGKTYSSTYPTVTGEGSASGKMNDFVVHPAFNFGGTPLTGFWIGKFETSFQRAAGEAADTAASGQYTGTDKTIMVKANISSWRENSISNMFDLCLNMNQMGNIYQLKEDGVKDKHGFMVDPHLLKNDEWGAVAYLSKSKYGKETEEVYINNNQNYITGIAGDTASVGSTTEITNVYNTIKGQKASTTGNIYGVYDMNGGAHEYTAAYVLNGHTNLTKNGASLTADTTEAKYRNVYDKGSEDTRQENYLVAIPASGHYGDAMYETSIKGWRDTSQTSSPCASWYTDYSDFPAESNPFFYRGKAYNGKTDSGVFAFYCHTGAATSDVSFRVSIPVF